MLKKEAEHGQLDEANDVAELSHFSTAPPVSMLSTSQMYNKS